MVTEILVSAVDFLVYTCITYSQNKFKMITAGIDSLTRASRPANLLGRGQQAARPVLKPGLVSDSRSDLLQMRTWGQQGVSHLPKDKPGLEVSFPDSKTKAISVGRAEQTGWGPPTLLLLIKIVT